MIGLSVFGECQRRGISNISNTSGSGSGGGSGNGGGSGSMPDIESQSNEDDVEFGMHSESDTDSESKRNTKNNEMLYAINEEDFDDSDAEMVQWNDNYISFSTSNSNFCISQVVG